MARVRNCKDQASIVVASQPAIASGAHESGAVQQSSAIRKWTLDEKKPTKTGSVMVVGLRSACNIYLAIVGSAIDGVELKPIPFNYESNCSGIGASRLILVALCGQSTGQLALLRCKLNGTVVSAQPVCRSQAGRKLARSSGRW